MNKKRPITVYVAHSAWACSKKSYLMRKWLSKSSDVVTMGQIRSVQGFWSVTPDRVVVLSLKGYLSFEAYEITKLAKERQIPVYIIHSFLFFKWLTKARKIFLSDVLNGDGTYGCIR